jgi:hypothetical protein
MWFFKTLSTLQHFKNNIQHLGMLVVPVFALKYSFSMMLILLPKG